MTDPSKDNETNLTHRSEKILSPLLRPPSPNLEKNVECSIHNFFSGMNLMSAIYWAGPMRTPVTNENVLVEKLKYSEKSVGPGPPPI